MSWFGNEFLPICEEAVTKYWELDDYEVIEIAMDEMFDEGFNLAKFSFYTMCEMNDRGLLKSDEDYDYDMSWEEVEQFIIDECSESLGREFTRDEFRYWAYGEYLEED